MSSLFTFAQIKKALANNSLPLVCVIAITLLTTSCATVPTKQTALADTTANSLTAEERSKEIVKKIECREVTATGSTIKRTVCEFKETWAEISKEKGEKADELIQEINRKSGIINPGQNSGNGVVNSAVTPPGAGF
jgi:hypothetical protein